MKLPKLGIVTPSFNQGKYIEETIRSVLSQRYPNLEYWVVDGGSTDSTLKILHGFGKKIHLISEKDKGQADAVNKGLRKIRGADLYAYLNSDDVYEPDTFKRVVDCYLNNRADWITGSYRIVDEAGKTIRKQLPVVYYKQLLLRNYSPFLLQISNSILPQPSTFWSKRALKTVGFFNSDYDYMMEYDYWLRLSRHFPLCFIDNPLSRFRIHSASISNNSYERTLRLEEKILLNNGVPRIERLIHKAHRLAAVAIYSALLR